MERDEFERLLRIGLGRAVLFLQGHDTTPYRDAILDACLHNRALDRQIEGSRAPYMFDIVQLTNEPGFYRDRILAALPNSTDWADTIQLFDFARLFAEHGDEQARQVMYETAAANIVNEYREDYEAGLTSVVELDGIQGLLFLADRFGERLLADPDFWVDERLQDIVEEQHGVAATQGALSQAAAGNSRLEAYIAAASSIRAQHEEYLRNWSGSTIQTYDELRRLIDERGAKAPRSWLIKYGQQAREDDVERIARDLLSEAEPGRLLAYLRVFRRRRFPLDHSRLLALAHHSDNDIAEAALAALAQISHPIVRELALSLLASSQRQADAVGLLVNNYRPGDYQRIEAAVRQVSDPEELHALEYDALQVVSANRTPDCQGLLLQLYEYGPCSHCREKSVDFLHSLGLLPEWVVEECRHDSSLDLREKGRRYREQVPSQA